VGAALPLVKRAGAQKNAALAKPAKAIDYTNSAQLSGAKTKHI
jgi:hypothetical protein